MGTFVPLSGPGAKAPAKGFTPIKSYDVKGDPDYKRERAKADRQRELADRGYSDLIPKGGLVDHLGGMGRALTSQPVLPILDEINAGVRAAGNEAVNLVRRARGEREVSSRAIYQAQMDADRESRERERAKYPVSTAVGGLLSGLTGAPAAAAVKAPAAVAAATRAAKAAQLGKTAAKSAGVGAAYGAAYGAADAQGADRLKEGVEGGVLGGLTGAALPVAMAGVAPVAKKTAGVAKDIARAVRKPTVEAEREVGAATARKILARKGLNADEVTRRAAELTDGLEPMAAELAGQDVERLTGAIARRAGTTGDLAMTRKLERQGGSADRVLDAADNELGIDAASAQGDIEEIVAALRKKADPLYAAMRENSAGIYSDELAGILNRPHARRAIAAVEESAASRGRPGVGLATGNVDVPSAPVGPADLGVGGGPVPVPRGPAQPPSRGPSALTALRQTGEGITADLAGEAKQQGLRLAAREGGAELNDMANRLYERGYTHRLLTEDEMADLLESGQARQLFAREPEPGAQGRFEARQAAEELNAQGGLPGDVPTPEQYEGSFAAPERPMQEPARTLAPTQESLDQVLTAMNDLIERDDVTGKIIRSGPKGRRNRDIETEVRALREAVLGGESPLAPEMKAARAASSDYRGIEDIFERAKGRFANGSFRDLKKVLDSAADDGEVGAVRAAVANDIYEMWQAGKVKAGRLTQPGMMAKLELLFPGKAKAFVRKVEQEAEYAAKAARIAPTGGSATAGLLEAGKEAERELASVGDLARIGGKFKRGELLSGTLDAVGTPLAKLYRYQKTAGMSEEARNALGEIMLMGPDDLIKFLREAENLPEPLREAVYDRAVALGLIGGKAAAQAEATGRQGQER